MKKTLRDLLEGLPVKNVYGSTGLPVTGFSLDSREVKKDHIFFALRGTRTDGLKFIPQAAQNGARIVISDELFSKIIWPPKLRMTYVQVEQPERFVAEISARFYETAGLPMKLIGITGTNGKTTTAFLINEWLKAAGVKTVFLGTIGFEVAGRKLPTDFTTPPAPLIHELLREGSDQGATFAVMEVSSHALKLGRVHGLQFDAAVFTNLTHEHRELHPDMEDYFQTKASLFTMLKPSGLALVQTDDPYGQRLLKQVRSAVDYGRQAAYLKLKRIEFRPESQTQDVSFVHEGVPLTLSMRMIGEFNAMNALAAFGVLRSLGFRAEEILAGFPALPIVDGRFNWLKIGDFNVIIDFAHTPDGLEQILTEIAKIKTEGGRLITVFGCPGSRDASKRPLMGRIATERSDHVIVTTDDIHHEEPQTIIDGIVNGLQKENYETVLDRREAIGRALDQAQKGDYVLIAGRGHERFQYVGDKKVPFYDREVILEEARSRGLLHAPEKEKSPLS